MDMEEVSLNRFLYNLSAMQARIDNFVSKLETMPPIVSRRFRASFYKARKSLSLSSPRIANVLPIQRQSTSPARSTNLRAASNMRPIFKTCRSVTRGCQASRKRAHGRIQKTKPPFFQNHGRDENVVYFARGSATRQRRRENRDRENGRLSDSR